MRCELLAQGYPMGACLVEGEGGSQRPACELTLREEGGELRRLIKSIHLSRPENYLSIYQSGCNLSCRKCHSWEFSRRAEGSWLKPEEIGAICREYSGKVTLSEPRERATAWHAQESCRCCGACVLGRERPGGCPRRIEPAQVVLSPQGFGPARNIVAFTGGDLSCKPAFYARCARLIKEGTSLWVLLETNGFGLTPGHLDLLAESGLDAFWLDIKAFDEGAHRWLTGCGNREILSLPEATLKRGFILEVLSLYIPGLLEADQLQEIARLLSSVDPSIPFTILAFFPQYRMMEFRAPSAHEMAEAYIMAREAGLERVRLGNLGVFAREEEDIRLLEERLGGGWF